MHPSWNVKGKNGSMWSSFTKLNWILICWSQKHIFLTLFWALPQIWFLSEVVLGRAWSDSKETLFIDLILSENLWTTGHVHFPWPESSNDSISDLARVCWQKCVSLTEALVRTEAIIWQTDLLRSVLTHNSLFHGPITVTLRKTGPRI